MSDWDRFGYRVIRNSLFGQKQEGGIYPPGGVQLPRSVFAVAIDGRRFDAQASGDLLGVQVAVDEAKAFALAVSQSISTARHLSPPGSQPTLTTGKGSPKRALRRKATINAC